VSDNLDSAAAAAPILVTLRTLAPALRARLPGVAVRFAGGSLPPDLLGGALDGLDVLSSMAPVGPVLDRARVVVVPQDWCSPDTRSNIAEARVRALPIVAPSVVLKAALSGDAARALPAETPDEFVEQILRAYGNAWWDAFAPAGDASADATIEDRLAHTVVGWVAADAHRDNTLVPAAPLG